MKTPDEEVADEIAEQLKKNKMLSDSNIEKLHPALVKGTMKAEDWKLLIETDSARNEKNK